MLRIHARSPQVVLLLGVLLGTGTVTPTAAQTSKFISIDAPHGVWDFTNPRGINDRGQIVGFYGNLGAVAMPINHGFSLIDGVFRTIDVANAAQTRPADINNRGTIVGSYVDEQGFHGFRLDGEVFTAIDVAGAVSTQVTGINDRGDVVGTYDDDSPQGPGSFILRNGEFTFLRYPGAAYTIAAGINNRGEVVGVYTSGGLAPWYGFRWSAGTFSTFGAPVGSRLNVVQGINDPGRIVGTYREEIGEFPGREHGFVLNKGQFVEIAVAGARRTAPTSINNAGWVVGIYESPSWLPGVLHGFAAHID